MILRLVARERASMASDGSFGLKIYALTRSRAEVFNTDRGAG
jgi:hypothetical protein